MPSGASHVASQRPTSRWEAAGRRTATQSGTTLIEMLVVVIVASLLLAVSAPSLMGAYRRQQLSSAAASVRGKVGHARLKALKEKTDHRIVFHDEDAITPNQVGVEEWQGGAFVALDALAYRLPQGVKILGASPMDSTDAVNVSRRGHCDSGNIYLSDGDGNVRTIEIKTSCFASTQ